MKFITIDKAHDYLKKVCIEQGNFITDERGDELYQIPFITVQFDENIHKRIGDLYDINIPKKVNYNMLKEYTEQLLNKDNEDFVYTYGNRFREYFRVDQYEYILNKLRENPNSRRAVALTWDVTIDTKNKEVPCLQLIKLSIVENKLVMTVVFRSNDLRYAFKYNMYALLKLQQWFAKELGIKPSTFNYVGLDLHYKLK